MSLSNGFEMSATIDDFGKGFSLREDMRDFLVRTMKMAPRLFATFLIAYSLSDRKRNPVS